MPTFGATITAQAWGPPSASGARTPTTYTVLPAPVRNLVTGQTTAAGTPYAVDMLLRAYRRTEIDGVQIVAGDRLARLPETHLPVTPTTRDTVTMDGVVWSIVEVAEGREWRLVAFDFTKASTSLACDTSLERKHATMTRLELVTELRDILRGVRELSQRLQATAARLEIVQEALEADDRPETGSAGPAPRTRRKDDAPED